MRLSRKLRKLFSPDLPASLVEHLSRWIHPISTRHILASLDQSQFEKLREQYPYRPGSSRINRFEDVNYWIQVNAERAQDLWLDRPPHLRVLDLGCGAGYFLYVGKVFGHDVLGFDTDDEPLFRVTTALLDVPRIIGRIERQVPLPDFGRKFDLITAHRICFNRLGRADNGKFREWSPVDWKFFIFDLRTRCLAPDGRLLLEFNPRADGSSFFTPELRECFLSEGARIVRSKALLAADPRKYPRFKP